MNFRNAAGTTLVIATLGLCVIPSPWARNPTVARAQMPKFDAKHLPRFEDFPVTEHWDGVPAPVRLATRSERMFRTRLTQAAKEPPNFASHYRIVIWGCGSNCRAGAVVDLKSGVVFPPPLSSGGEGWNRWGIGSEEIEHDIDSRPNSRLAIVNSMDVPDVYYFVWEGNRFRQVLHVRATSPVPTRNGWR
jgi:hypothetical protein